VKFQRQYCLLSQNYAIGVIVLNEIYLRNETAMTDSKRKILVTAALPYANGSIHLGHLVGYIQTDIWVRFQKMQGHDCIYVCGDDAHGTPIMLRAQQEGITPEELVEKMLVEHQQDFSEFFIGFDNYYTTHSEENRILAEDMYQKLYDRGDIEIKTISQAYDPEEKMFLPDRFVKGECPRCNTPDQYGDNCEACGATYLPTDLKNPVSVISGATPIEKESEHYFFKLSHYQDMLQKWIHEEHLQEQVINKLNEWFQGGLQDWDISRDEPYFGFEIPNAPGKYLYVWLDAPIGYMASFKNLCDKVGNINFEEYWGADSTTELYHFIGKDIIYFHALFWPAMLTGANYRMPTAVFANGFLTVDGKKMSKSRGTFINARTYLDHLDPEYLRYYFAAKLSSNIDDLDLNFDDFRQRVNADLVGKFINIASRCAGFISKHFDNQLSESLSDPILFEKFSSAGDSIASHYETREYNRAIREISALADLANQYIDDQKPWVLIKEEENSQKVHEICSMGMNLFRILMLYLKPVLPNLAIEVKDFLNIPELQWSDRTTPLLSHDINVFKPLLQRVDEEKVTALKESCGQA